MPTASLLLPLLARLRRLIPSVLALLPVLLRPPPMAPRLSPLALLRPPFVQRLALLALRPLAFLATASNHARPPHRPAVHRPAACPLALWQSTGVRRQARQACVRLIPLLGDLCKTLTRGGWWRPRPAAEGPMHRSPQPPEPSTLAAAAGWPQRPAGAADATHRLGPAGAWPCLGRVIRRC